MSERECAVCSNTTAKKCAACEVVAFCSPSCQRAVWSTHKWLCGKSTDTFSQAPLTLDEVNLLHKLDKMPPSGSNSPTRWHYFLKRDRLSSRGVNDLLRELQDPECRISEPSRTLILSELRGNLFRAGADQGLLPDLEITPWTLVGRLHREFWRDTIVELSSVKDMACVLAPSMQQYLLLETLRARRASAKGLPAGLKGDVEALALQRTTASLADLGMDAQVVRKADRARVDDPETQRGAASFILRVLNKCENSRTTETGRRTFFIDGTGDILSIVRSK